MALTNKQKAKKWDEFVTNTKVQNRWRALCKRWVKHNYPKVYDELYEQAYKEIIEESHGLD